ncbi:cora-domain-containing protein [Thozetella sp. PMI_491]|nr:cora-domain-containing protein [Thozetella sp. PMI_491]
MDPRRAEGRSDAPGPSSASAAAPPPRKKKGHRGGKKKKSRRKSFAAPIDDSTGDGRTESRGETREAFYLHGRNLSNTSIDSQTLLDHRLRMVAGGDSGEEEDGSDSWNEGAPLLSQSMHQRAETFVGYGGAERSRQHSPGASSRASSKRKLLNPFGGIGNDSYNVNYPPSIPATPQMRSLDPTDMSFGDMMLRDGLQNAQLSPRRSLDGQDGTNGPPSMFPPPALDRRHTIAQEDVCFPQEGLSELADDEIHPRDPPGYRLRSRRRRGKWPDLSILDEWSRFEEEGRNQERRAKKITEPQLINGRLRPVNRKWFQTEEEAPYRFTYFNEEFQSTIHSQTISELVQPGGSFRELFIPDPPVLSDSSDDDEQGGEIPVIPLSRVLSGQNGDSRLSTQHSSLTVTGQNPSDIRREQTMSPSNNGKGSDGSKQTSGNQTPAGVRSPQIKSPLKSPEPAKPPKPIRYGERPVWWLDILSPTEAEMKVLSKAFGIHPLTAEDIMVQEQREKVELFRNYYFVNYRSFDQDQTSENFLEPVNMYVVVFREGVLSFHFSVSPHPANVRRRIRQLSDYLILSSDWISYAIIDDITDVYVPLIQNIEDEVDDIDDTILQIHSLEDSANKSVKEKPEDPGAGRDMLRRVGDCRKKVMLLYRLLGNKADVIKGFAKRCNEHWEVAPRSEIGLYLGDIQDHIVTMTANLSHYEKILSRAHGNYLAQINIRMNERQEQTADVLGKLTVLGTIVLPMNVITGLWGMNVWVPGQTWEGDLTWFWCIAGALVIFGVMSYMIAKRVYNIV